MSQEPASHEFDAYDDEVPARMVATHTTVVLLTGRLINPLARW